jgi:phosphohistidine phosphatase
VQLLLIRHAPAEEREVHARSGQDDRERPLTERGRARMQRAARALPGLVPALDVIATSPLRRARETAEIVARAYGGPEPALVSALAPGARPAELAEWLAARAGAAAVAAGGHEPDLGHAIAWLLCGRSRTLLELKKGGACLLELSEPIGKASGLLVWALQPGQLRRLSAGD